ncbi:MAG: peptide ABC transporter substrate-binding protein [Anaerolineales bacterium]|nr:peptide ABC transporter substrate-binding protein [Anaerolineales bacterium]
MVLGLLVTVSMALAACGPAPTAPPAEQVVVTQEVIVTQEVEVEVEREAFTTPHPILSDLRVRQAIAHCTNKPDLIKSVYPLLDEEEQASLVMHTFIPRAHWAYAGDENITIYDFDPAKGAALLDEAGWTLAEGATFRTNANGDELSLKFTTTSAAFRQTWAAIFEQQMAACGIRIVRLHAPASWWFGDTTGLARRDFELGAFAWVGQADPGGQTLWACDQIPTPANGWEGQNYMGWCNEEASRNIKIANNTLVQDERIAAYRVVQQEYTKDVPAIPLFNRTETFAAAADITGFQPVPGQEYYNYNVQEWEKAGSNTIVLGFTQEPASLFTLVEDAFVANIAYQIIRPAQEWHLNYEFTNSPVTKELPTLENGGTTNNDVEVKEGDKVVDANGDVVDLAPGVSVINAAGETVEFSGGTVTMKQLVSRFELADGLTWEDGTPVSSADLELGHRISCDPESGATTFITCDKTANVEFLTDAVGYIQTWLPGVQDPLYFVPVWPIYPAHQLGDLPAAQWATDPRVAEQPLAYGPYKLVQWEKGQFMRFEANEHWLGEPPKTPNFVIQFVTAESAESLLLSGEVDILASETLAGLSQALADAEAAGTIKTFVEAGATWEHIDFSLFIR